MNDSFENIPKTQKEKQFFLKVRAEKNFQKFFFLISQQINDNRHSRYTFKGAVDEGRFRRTNKDLQRKTVLEKNKGTWLETLGNKHNDKALYLKKNNLQIN